MTSIKKSPQKFLITLFRVVQKKYRFVSCLTGISLLVNFICQQIYKVFVITNKTAIDIRGHFFNFAGESINALKVFASNTSHVTKFVTAEFTFQRMQFSSHYFTFSLFSLIHPCMEGTLNSS